MSAMWCEDGWRVYSKNAESDGVHTVYLDLSACSCKDNRFRGGECKHIRALKELRQ